MVYGVKELGFGIGEGEGIIVLQGSLVLQEKATSVENST